MSAALDDKAAVEPEYRAVVVTPEELDLAEPYWRPWLTAWAARHGAEIEPIIAGVRNRSRRLYLAFRDATCDGVAIVHETDDVSGRRWLRLHVLFGLAWPHLMQTFDVVAREQGAFGVTFDAPPEHADSFEALGFSNAGIVLRKAAGAQ